MSENLTEVSEIFTTYCTFSATLLKSTNFLIKFKKIMALKESIHKICVDEEIDHKSEEFVKEIKLGYYGYRTLLSLGWLK